MINNLTWQASLSEGIRQMLSEFGEVGQENHTEGTPLRVVESYRELFSGVGKDPAEVLRVSFEEAHYNQMITVESIDFVSSCQHHLLPFYGTVNFSYLPDKRIVGLSKIPRMIDILARRPQVQERLTQQIVDTFQETVQPLGCAAMVRAWHACAAIRGVKKPNIRMRTTALTGYFLAKPAVKEEFLLSCRERS